jgi:hypothetical protein
MAYDRGRMSGAMMSRGGNERKEGTMGAGSRVEAEAASIDRYEGRRRRK